MTRKKIFFSICVLVSVFVLQYRSFAQFETRLFKKGSAIIDMGSVSPTTANSLKPYGLIYALLSDKNVPVYQIINQAKAKDGIDFVHNGKSYSGGSFIVPKEFFRASVESLLSSWARQGVFIDYAVSDFTLDNAIKYAFAPKWTMDKNTGTIAVGFLNAAGIPSSAFSFKEPSALDGCDDIFVLPHADPTWEVHRNLYFWNQTYKGNIWAGCNAVSVLENIVKDTTIGGTPTQIKMNFLSNNGLVLYSDHQRATEPFAAQFPADPVAQYMGKTDGAQQNGAETIYMPKIGGGWNPGTKIITYSPVHPDVPGISPGLAVKNIYGRAFNDPARGYVCYQASHNINGILPNNISAQRIFLNFSFFSLREKATASVSNVLAGVPDEMKTGTTYTGLDGTATGTGGPFTYQWLISIGGTFGSPNSATTDYTPDASITTATSGVLSCIVTDACGRRSIASKGITIVPGATPPTAPNIDKLVSGDCPVNGISFNVFDGNNDPNSGTRTLVSLGSFSNGTATFTSSGAITYSSAQNFKGIDAASYSVSNGVFTSTGTITLTVGTVALAPVTTNDAATVLGDNLTQINVLDNDKSNAAATNGSLLYIRDISQKPAKGYVYINSNGTVSYLSQSNTAVATGSDVFKYLACNDAGYCSEGTVNITITQNNCASGNYKTGTDVPEGPITSTTLTASADTYISAVAAEQSTNFGTNANLILNVKSGAPSADKRVLLKFDIPSSIATTTTITSATLSLTFSSSFTTAGTSTPFAATVAKLNQSWTESGARWTNYDGTNAWGSAGAKTAGTDFITNSTSQTFPTQANTAADVAISATVTDNVQSWITTPSSNKGFIVIPRTTAPITTSLDVNFYSINASVTSDKKPTLIISYPSTPAVTYSCVSIPTNYKPVAYPDTARTYSNAAVTIDAMLNDANYYGRTNTLSVNTNAPQHGTAAVVSGKIVYTPSGSFVGIDTLIYTITDGTNGQTNTATVRVIVQGVAPNIIRDDATTPSGIAITINVGANDTDPQGSIDAPSLFALPKNGNAVISGNNIVYTPAKGYIGKDTLIYRRSGISNNSCITALSDTAIVIITMTNQAPVAVNDTVTLFACSSKEISVKTNDTDPEGTLLTASIVSIPAHGTAVLNGNGSFTYTPTSGYSGTDQFTYKVKDGSVDSLSSNTATVVITVSNAANPNSVPVANANNEATLINQPVNTDVLANDTDPDGDPLTVNISAAGLLAPANGTILLLPNKMIRYIPNPGFTGTDVFEYQICDTHPTCAGNSSLCATGTVTIRVTPLPILAGGTIWNDADGSAAGTFTNIVTNSEKGTNADGAVYVYLTDNTNTIIDRSPVDAAGKFLFVNAPANSTNLKVILSAKELNVDDTLTVGSMPTGFINSSPVIKTITTGTASITGIDFGINQLPYATLYTFATQLNPGALTTVDATKITGTDPDGTIIKIRYKTFPTNISAIEIGGTSYTAGTWPANGVTVNVNTSVKIFPDAGSVTPVISFVVIDNSNNESVLPANITVPFYIPLTAGVVSGGATFCASGIPSIFTSTTNASGGQAAIVYQWQMSSVIGFGTFTNIEGATSATYTPSTAITSTTYFRRKVSTSGDAALYSNILTVTINPLPAAPAGLSVVSSVAAPVALSATASGTTGDETVDWYAAQSGGTALVSGVSGSLTTIYNTPTLANTTSYFAAARNVTTGCISLVRTVVTGTISGTLYPGVIGSDQTGCGTFTPTGFTSVNDASGLSGITYQWQSSTTSATAGFANIGGATSSTYSPGAISTTTYYKRIATSGSSFSSNVVTVTANPLPAVPTGSGLNGARTGPGTVLLSGTVPAGVIFDWYNNTTGSGLLLSGSNEFTTPVISQTTTYYPLARVIATGCVSARTAAVATVNPLLSGGLINSISGTVCGKGKPAAFTSETAPSGGTGAYIYQWQLSTSSSTDGFTDIAGANASTFTPSDTIFTNTFYRRKVSTSVDDAVYSNVVVVTVLTLPNVKITPANATIINGGSRAITASGAASYVWTPSTGLSASDIESVIASPVATTTYTVTGTSSGCSNTASITVIVINPGTIGSNQVNCGSYIPATLTSVADASGTSGITYQWQSSTTSASSGFSNITGATASTYTASAAITTTTYYRRVATGGGLSFNSNTITATVNAVPVVSIAPTAVTTVASLTQTLSASGADIYTWLPSTGLSASNTASVVASPSATTTYTVTGTITATACTATSSVVVTVVPPGTLIPGIIGSNQTICSTATPGSFTSTAASGGTGTISYQWQQSTDNISFSNISGAISATYSAPSLTQTMYYRRGASTSLNAVVYSNTVKLTVLAKPVIVGGINGPCGVTKDSVRTYSVTAVAGATHYIWTLPNGWTGSSTTNSINVKAGSTSGIISVTPFNGNCSGDPITFQAIIIDFAKVAISGVPVTASGNKNNSITVTITLYDANGNQIPCSGGVATLCSNTAGAVFSPVIDNGNGTYTSSLTSPANQVDICGTVSGIPIEKTFKVTFTGPQGSIKSNGPILATETPTVTFTATAGLAPFTVIYRSDKSTKNDTLTNVTSGVARNVALIPSTTLYTLVSVIDANGERRDNNFIRDTTTTRVLAPKVIITLNAAPATKEKDSSWATKIFVKTKNIGDLDLTSSQARLDLGTVFPKPVTFVLDSVTYSGTTIVPNRNYDGISNSDLFARINNRKSNLYASGSLRDINSSNNSADNIAAPDGSIAMELWQDRNSETKTENSGFEIVDDGHSIYMFGPLSSLPIGVEADMVLYLHVRPNGYTEPFVMQAVALGTGSTEGATALATSLSNDNNDIATHPEVTKKGEPLPAVINLFPTAVVGASLSAGTPVLQGNGTYNVLLSYKIKNYGTVNLSSLNLFQNLATSIGSPAVFTVTGAAITTTGTIFPNPAFDGKLDSNLLAANSVLGYKQEALLQYTVNIKPNQFSAVYQLRARATAFSSELNTTITDLSTNGTDPDTDGNNIPSEKIITEIIINTPIPPVVPGNIGIKTGPTTTVPRKSFCGPTSGVVIVPTSSNSGGINAYEYQWQSSVDSIAFYDIEGASADTFVTGQVNSSIYLRRGTISGSQVKYSNVVYVQIFPVTKPTITAGGGSFILPQSGGVSLSSSLSANYLWSNAATTRTVSVTAGGVYTVTTTDANGCSAVSDTVRVYPAPSIGIQTGPSTTVPAKSYCGPTSGVVIIPTTTGNAPDTYQWQSSTDNISFVDITGAVAASYTSGQVNSSFYLRRKTTIGSSIGYSNSVYIQIFPLTKPTITASGPLVLTQNGTITLTASSASTYLWSTNATTNLIVVSLAGTYAVTATDANGCSVASDPVKIAPPPPVTANATYIIGATTNPVNSGVQVTGLPAAVLNYYIVSTGGVLIPVPVLPSVIGVYTYYVSQTVNGMESVLVPYTVTMLDPGKVADVQKVLTKAPALQSDGSYLTGFTIYASNLRNELLDSVRIKDDLTKVFPGSVLFEVVDIKASGQLIANPLYNGNSQIELLNNVSKLPGMKTDSVELMLKVIPNGFSGTLNNTAVQTVRSPYGSFSTTSNDPLAGNGFVVRNPTKFIIPLIDISIPTGLSPNHDGVNDKFVITHPFNTTINLEITNRWGNLVYKSPDYKNEFEGKGSQANRIMGEDLPDGTYYYIVLATDKTTGSVRKFAGFITLKR